MKKITIQEPVQKLVSAGTIDVEAFEASDGKVFKGYGAETKCERYEKKLSYKPIMDKVKITYTSNVDAGLEDDKLVEIWADEISRLEEELNLGIHT